MEERGHEVIRLRDVLATDTPDPIVAKTALDMDAILISDDKDFDTLAKPNKKKPRFRRLSRVNMRCKHSIAVQRLAAAITLIEFEYEAAQARPDRRMIVDVATTVMRLVR